MALQLATAGTGVARDNHYVTPNGTNVPIRTLLLEPQRTNLVWPSEDFTGARWPATASSVTTNATAAPDGATTADKLVENNANATHFIQQTMTLTANTVYTISVFAKAAERTRIVLGPASNVSWVAAAGSSAQFDLSAGTVIADNGQNARITPLANGWYRLSVTRTFGPSNATGGILIVLLGPGNAGTYTGDGTSGVFLFGGQIEAGPEASAYVPTSTGTVTRNADNLYWSLASLNPCREMTVYTRSVVLNRFTTGGRRIFHVGDTLASGVRFFAETNSGGFFRLTHDNGVTGVDSDGPTGIVRGDIMELRGVLAASGAVGLNTTVNGGAETTGVVSAGNALAANWAETRFYLNSASDGGENVAAYTHAAIALGQKSRAEMRAIVGVV
jgi:hypothetical protein